MSEPVYMSREGVRKLEEEIKRLKFEERPKIVEEIRRSRELGDLSENAEYHAAKEAQRHLERKISELEYKLSRVQTIDTDAIASDKAYLFAKVLVKDVDSGEEIEYTLSPPDEADVDNDIISVESPVGKALLGRSAGESVEIKAPARTIRYDIVRISRD